MRCREGLVQVQMHHVEPYLSHLHYSHNGIHIRAITVNQTSFRMDNLCDFSDIFFEKPQRVRVGYHNSSRVFVHDGSYGFCRYDPIFARLYRHRTKPAECGTRGIGAVRGVGDDNL